MESKTTNLTYKKWYEMTLKAQVQENSNMRVLRGKLLVNERELEATFAQALPRGARSVEVGRTSHSRFVRRPDGLYTITLRVSAKEKYLKEALVAEMRDIATAIQIDSKAQEPATVKAEQKGAKE